MSGLRIKGLGEEIATLANLPWDKPLEGWPEDEVLTSMRGISRHVVRLIRSNPSKSNSQIFAVKETVPEFANREYFTSLVFGGGIARFQTHYLGEMPMILPPT